MDIEIIVAPENAWAKFALGKHSLGPWMGFSVNDDGTPYIQLGEDSNEEIIEGALNHEYLHHVLWKLGENTYYLDNIWLGYIEHLEIPNKIIEFLKGYAHSGIGFTT